MNQLSGASPVLRCVKAHQDPRSGTKPALPWWGTALASQTANVGFQCRARNFVIEWDHNRAGRRYGARLLYE